MLESQRCPARFVIALILVSAALSCTHINAQAQESSTDCASIYNEGQAFFKQKDYESAADRFTSACACFEQRPGGPATADTGQCYYILSVAYAAQKKYGPALESANKALDIFTALPGDSRLTIANIHFVTGSICFEQWDYPCAQENFAKALDISAQIHGEDNESVAAIHTKIGHTYRNRWYFNEAMEHYSKALNIYLKLFGENDLRVADLYNYTGLTYFSQGDLERAIEAYMKAVEINLKINGEDNKTTAGYYNNIGSAYDAKRDFENALKYHEKSLALYQSLPDAGEANIANSYNSIGMDYYHHSEYDKAIEYYSKALAIYLGIESLAVSPAAGNCYNNIGVAYFYKNDYANALEFFIHGLEIREQTLAFDNPLVGASYNDVCSAYASLGDMEQALAYCDKALESLCGGKTVPSAGDCFKDIVTPRALARKGKILADSGRLREAADFYILAAAALDLLRQDIVSSPSKRIIGSKMYALYPRGIGVFHDLFSQSGDSALLEQAFEFAEMGIARVFLDEIGQSLAQTRGGLSEEDIQQGLTLQDLRDKARKRINEIEKTPVEQQNADARGKAYDELFQAEKALADYEAQLRADHPEYAQMMNPQMQPLSKTRDTVLAPGEAALEYYLGEEASWLLFITKDNIKIEQLPPKAEIEAKILDYRRVLADPRHAREILGDEDLYNILIGPVVGDLAGIDRLLIIPTGKLYFLPFETLMMENGGYLVERFDVRYAPSLNVLYLNETRRAGRERKWDREWLAFGDPLYDDPADARLVESATDTFAANPEQERGAIDASMRGSAGACYGGEKPVDYWKRLEYTRGEIEGIATLFGGGVDVFLDEKANEDTFKSLLNGERAYRFIHIAAHGTVALAPGQQPGLVLSLPHSTAFPATEDGYLTMSEVFDMKIPAELVVLSACMTGCGAEQPGEGVAGLARAFFYAGADSLVVSLWSVNDELTGEFMAEFYKKMIQEKMNPRTALKETKKAFIAAGRSPYYWAPFVYIGVGYGN